MGGPRRVTAGALAGHSEGMTMNPSLRKFALTAHVTAGGKKTPVRVSEESVLKRINELIGVGGQTTDRSNVSNGVAGRVYMGTLGIAISV
jgi:hypothetical protein